MADTLLAYSGANEALAALGPRFGRPGYGPLQFEPGKALALPKGFHYRRFGRAGSMMSDGLRTPTAHDGTGYFKGRRDTVWIARNHEGYHAGRAIGPRDAYDRIAQGGVTISHYNTRTGKLLGSALVLNGTDTNCSGGRTPWGTWLTCEESTFDHAKGFERKHGYVFEVPARATSTVEAVPIKPMGRFVHEACGVDPKTGVVYMTEDNGHPGDGFYRYLPDHKGKLHRGGKLQMLAIKGRPKYNTTAKQTVGRELECRWVTIDDPDPNGAGEFPQAVYMQGREQGGARFLRLEGADFHRGGVYFTATSAGDAGQGQIWRYTPDNRDFKRGTLMLLFESPRNRVLNAPDAVAGSPRGGVVLLEDGDGEYIDGADNWIRGLTPDGQIFSFAKVTERLGIKRHIADDLFPFNERRFNRPPRKPVGASEATGVGYSPDGRWMFVNLQYPGETFAITGPWQKGWL